MPTVPPVPPPTPVLPLHPANTSRQPFCEHVLQHSCCSTFLWQRLFFLTSTQKLPSAQDSSFAFHRPGRRSVGVGRGVERRREREREIHKHMQEQARDQSHVIGQQRFQMTGGGFCFSFFFFLIQSQVMFIEVEMIAVQWVE